MTTQLDVLVIERRPGCASTRTEELEAAGHRVHHCYPDPTTRPDPTTSAAPLCKAITDGECPIDSGIDVTFVVRDRIAVQPSFRENGVSCAIRAGIPVVEEGTDLFDPYGPWLTARVQDGDVVGTCERAVDQGFEPLRAEIRYRIAPSLAAAAIDPDQVGCRFEVDGPRLVVVLTGPPAARGLQQALGVRVLDAVRATPRTFPQVDVTYEEQA